jgi:undecaprenyl-diphosphatase
MAIALVFLIALSRLYLGAHYLSDVLGAMAAGMVWLTLCLTTVEIFHRYRTRSLSGALRWADQTKQSR